MRFVRRVHRRLVVVRALERGGACVGVASIFACVFASVALAQGRDAMPLVLPTLLLGAAVGVLWGFSRRPTRFEAVVEADRQLALDDLLATAYAQRGGGDPWQLAVVAIADARCRTLSADAVIVHRYGGRAWGGIGLAAATGLTLALLSGVPQPSRARPADADHANVATAEARPVQPDHQAHRSSPPNAARAHASPESRGGRRGLSPAAHGADATRGRASDHPFAPAADDAGDGGERAGQTAIRGDGLPRPLTRGSDASDDAAATAGGGAAGAESPAAVSADWRITSGRSASPGSARPNRATPPWSLPSWDADRAAAGDAVRAGRVPDAYRDVVSEYFQEPGSVAGSQ